jgi:hypothetical protein
MATYKIIALNNHQVLLQYSNNIRKNFPLVLDENNNYPSGQALQDLLNLYVENELVSISINETKANNEQEIVSLIEAPTETENSIRFARNRLLRQSDWTQANDSPLDTEQKNVWANYRTALRNITTQSGFPTNVEWPVVPAK